MDDFDKHFEDNYNTKLTPEQEAAYQKWVEQQSFEKQRDYSRDTQDYDLRGAWKEIMSGQMSEADNGHLGDKYKKPNHPTFSDQSIYNNTPSPWGGMYQGGTWGQSNGQTTYTPTAEMLKTTHPLGWLQKYMSQVEPDVILNMDRK